MRLTVLHNTWQLYLGTQVPDRANEGLIVVEPVRYHVTGGIQGVSPRGVSGGAIRSFCGHFVFN
jgi:hypothetical protein